MGISAKTGCSHLLEVNNRLELQIATLNQQLNGELIAPEKVIDKHGHYYIIANKLIDTVFEKLNVPLKFTGLDEKDGYAIAGYTFSKSANPQKIVSDIAANSKTWARNWGIHAIDSISVSPTYPAIEAIFRRDRPTVVKDDEVYTRYGLVKASLFAETIRSFHNNDASNGSKPTLRIMGGTGGGKTLSAKILAQYYVNNLDDWEIWFSDPQDDSDKDYWDSPKIARGAKEAAKAFGDFVSEYDARKSKTSPHPDTYLMAIFDEFDKDHSLDDKEQAKRIWTAIRHRKMLMCLLGQSSQVGENNWKWDNMKNCALMFIGDAVTTATKVHKELGWSLKLKNQIQREYEEISNWMDGKNELLTETPERQYRLALIASGNKYKFLEIPPAIEGSIKNNRSYIASKPFEFLSQNTVEVTNHQSISTEKLIKCPNCNSNAYKKDGKHWKNKTLQMYRCKQCNEKFSQV